MSLFIKNKILIISYLCLFIGCINLHSTQAQILGGGQHPPGMKWRQINTENFQLLYPSALEFEAQRMANTVDFLISRISHTLNKKPRPISIILHNQTVESNGFVQLAPRRSEFYAIPGQEFDYQDWLNSLAVHELRHVVQLDKIAGNLRAPLFESLAFSFFGITLPAWFFEGDAVVTETALTKAGRGRQPSWEMPFRANLLNGRDFSYSKNYLGSYKDRTPGYYQLGYLMMAKLRRDQGPYILDTLFLDMTRNPLKLANLSQTSKTHTGLTTRQWHNATLAEMKNLWQKQLEETPSELYPGINIRKDTIPEDYLLPQSINEQEIVALKRSKVHTPALVLLNRNGKEKKLLLIGLQLEPHISYAGGKVVWDELRIDKRYDKRSFSVICLYDLQRKTYRQLTHRSRLFSPSLSPDGKKIAAIEVDFSNRMSVVELDAQNGKILKKYLNPEQSNLQTPKYDAQGKKLVYLRVSQEGKAIEELDTESGKVQQKLTSQSQLLSRPSYLGEDILFKAHYNGIDNIYRLEENGEIKQLSFATYGAFYPIYDQKSKTLLFSNYQLNGYDVTELLLAELQEKPVREVKNPLADYIKPLAVKERGPVDFSSIPQKNRPSRPYSPFKHLINFHSILPILEQDSYNDELNFGAQAVSGDLFNNFDINAGYVYYTGLQKSGYRGGFSYKAWYPILSVNFEDRPMKFSNPEITAAWREQETELNLDLPFRFNFLNQFGSTGLELATSYLKRYQVEYLSNPNNQQVVPELRFPMRYAFYFEQNSMTSSRDLAPRWGHNYRFGYRHFPFDKQFSGKIWSLQTLFFSPGLFRNHSFSASINFQRSSGDYTTLNDIPTVSGFNKLDNTNTGAIKNTILLDYRFPLAYPDWEIGPLAYLKRIRVGLFADFQNFDLQTNTLPRTYGLELSADINLLRLYLPNFRPAAKMIFNTDNTARNPIFEFGLIYSY